MGLGAGRGAWQGSEVRWGGVAWCGLGRGGPPRGWGGEGLPFLSSGRSSPVLPAPPLPGSLGSMGDQGVSTQLLVPIGSVCFSYTSAPWRLFLRKEVGMRAGEGVAGCAGPRWGTPVSVPHAQTRGAAAPRPRRGIFCLAWKAGGEGREGAVRDAMPTLALLALLQVFYPRENFSHPYNLRLLCEQVRGSPPAPTPGRFAPVGPLCGSSPASST